LPENRPSDFGRRKKVDGGISRRPFVCRHPLFSPTFLLSHKTWQVIGAYIWHFLSISGKVGTIETNFLLGKSLSLLAVKETSPVVTGVA
jgi:hypothetical protein